MSKHLKFADFIRSKVPTEELLAGLAEEATELAQAALKCRRAITGINPTPVSSEAAWEGFMEEVADVNLYMDLLLPSDSASILSLYEAQRKKEKRWVQRLKEAGGE